jgi:hypothetical protein
MRERTKREKKESETPNGVVSSKSNLTGTDFNKRNKSGCCWILPLSRIFLIIMMDMCININRSITILLKNKYFSWHSYSCRYLKFWVFIFLSDFWASLQDLVIFLAKPWFIYPFFKASIRESNWAISCYLNYCSLSRSSQKEQIFLKNC